MIAEKLFTDNFPGCRSGWTDSLEMAANLMPENCRIIETGAFWGGSAIAMATVVKSKNGLVYSVEPGFLNFLDWPSEWDFKQDIDSSIELFMHNIYKYDVIGHVVPLPGVSDDIVKIWNPNTKFDMLVIDGLHSYEGVTKDLLWAKFLKEEAIIIFDDWIEEVERAAMDFFKKNIGWREINMQGAMSFARGYNGVQTFIR